MSLLQRASFWAHSYPVAARLIITIATILQVLLHYYWGLYLFAYDIILPYSFAIGLLILGVSAALLYPIRGNSSGIFADSFRKQKVLGFAVFMIGGLLVMYLGNQRAVKVFKESEAISSIQEEPQSDVHAVYKVVSSGEKQTEEPEFSLSPKEMRKQLKAQFKAVKKLIKEEIREARKNRKKGERGTGGNILLTILAVLVAFFLGTLVLALSCSLLCNNNALAGSVILVIGWAGILVLLFFVIKKIFGTENRGQPTPKSKNQSYPY